MAKAQTLTENERDLFIKARDNAASHESFWVAFQMLKEHLGATSYRDAIRSAMKAAETAPVPDVYKYIWRLGFSGILNLNLDRLAGRSHSEIRSGKLLYEFCGREAGQRLYLLKGRQPPFVVQLHGVVEDESSWVFTHDELKSLSANSGYTEFIRACLATRTVLFLAISAEDFAAGGHLQRLREMNLDVGTHFWLTDRTDTDTDRWAESVGIRVIRYANADRTHSAVGEFFEDLLSYLPADVDPDPVSSGVTQPSFAELPSPEELMKEDADTIRYYLNTKATEILTGSNPYKYDVYDVFCKKYNQAIYRAWYVSQIPPDNELLGYTILDEIASGAFGTVYVATDKNGDNLAIKVLHERVRNQPQMLQSFRRGVKSMEILSQHGLSGVVPYKFASEIPAFVVMDYVQGPTLQEAVEKHRIKDWRLVLRIASALVAIIRRSHQLPERVLHRDIRPSNIMLRNGWSSSENDWEVLVLDFDLSWHRDATEMSIMAGTTLNAYLGA